MSWVRNSSRRASPGGGVCHPGGGSRRIAGVDSLKYDVSVKGDAVGARATRFDTNPVSSNEVSRRDESLSRLERVGRIVENHRNTATFDHTYHPALTLPCGDVDGLPVGLQLVGSHFDEATLFGIAQSIEGLTETPAVPVDV